MGEDKFKDAEIMKGKTKDAKMEKVMTSLDVLALRYTYIFYWSCTNII